MFVAFSLFAKIISKSRNKVKEYRVNQQVLTSLGEMPVRCVDNAGAQLGLFPTSQALQLAQEKNLDLVLLVPDAKPPVCRLCNYSKFRYALQKNASQSRKNQKQSQLKEVKLRPSTGESDYQTKLNKVIKFLQDRSKVRIVVRFRGREIVHRRLGLDYLERLRSDVAKFGAMEKEPEIEGRNMVMLLVPR